jgi:AcrR family transcriptional regulator
LSIQKLLAIAAMNLLEPVAMARNPDRSARERVLAAAREQFFAQGVEGTSIAEICRLSGVSNGSLFHHFGSKEAIALDIFIDVRRSYWQHVLGAMEACQDVPGAAEASVRAAFEFQQIDPDAYMFMLDTSAAPWVLRHTTALKDLNAAFSERAMRWAMPHIIAGKLPALSIHTFGALIFGLPQWIARETRAGLSVPDREVVIGELSALMRKLFTV